MICLKIFLYGCEQNTTRILLLIWVVCSVMAAFCRVICNLELVVNLMTGNRVMKQFLALFQKLRKPNNCSSLQDNRAVYTLILGFSYYSLF